MAFPPNVRLIHNRKNKLNKAETAVVQIEITYRSKRKFLSTGVMVKPSHWNGRVIKHRDAIHLNKQINKLKQKIFDYIDSVDEFSFDGLNDYLGAGDPESFIEYCEQYLETREKIKKSTLRQYNSALAHLRNFGKIKSFSDLTYKNVDLFEQYLASKGLSGHTRRAVHTRIKMIANDAHLSRRMPYNDYQKFRLPKAETWKIRYLIDEELKLLTDKKLPIERLNNIRDIFLFQCYTGLAYVDVQKLTPKDVKVENGDKWIITERVKTGTTSEIYLLPEALKLIEKHKGGEKLLPVPSNQRMNAYLKEIQLLCGIEKDLTSHVARHTFATYCLNRDVNIAVLARTLGHSSIKTTERYAKTLRHMIKEEMKKLN